jgi:protein-disulfide isomerase
MHPGVIASRVAFLGLGLTVVVASSAVPPVHAADPVRPRATPAASGAVTAPPGASAPVLTREQVEEIVREYITKNPEVVVDAVRAMEDRKREAQAQASRTAIAARQAELLRDSSSPVAGNVKGDVTIVEFFDYKCGYCKAVAPTVKQLLAEDANIRLIYKELPILGEESRTASRAALAARAQGKYRAFHEALMSADGALTKEEVFRIAGSVGLDVAKLEQAMASKEIDAVLNKNRALASAIGLRGTPAFVIGSELVPGAVPLERFKELVARARAASPAR